MVAVPSRRLDRRCCRDEADEVGVGTRFVQKCTVRARSKVCCRWNAIPKRVEKRKLTNSALQVVFCCGPLLTQAPANASFFS